MKKDKNRKYINYVVDHLVADTERTEFPGIIDPPFISGVETTSLYTDLAHVQEWKTRQYDSFVEYVKDIYGVIDKELALVWNLYGRRYMNLYDSEEMLNEETMDHPFLGPNYYPGEEFFQNSKEQLHQIIDRLMKESYPIDDEDDQSFFYGWMEGSPPHLSPDQFGARHYTILRNHLKDIYDIRGTREVDYIWDKYYRELLRKYAR